MNLTIMQRRLLSLLKFLVVFNVMAIPLQLLLYFDVNLNWLASIERSQVSLILSLLRVNHELLLINDLPSIRLGNHTLIIGEACTSIRSLLAFIALVIASPRRLVTKLRALINLPVIYVANIIRLVTLALISANQLLFNLLHVILWREGLIVLIVLLWVHWFKSG